jgi:hypothetical protein
MANPPAGSTPVYHLRWPGGPDPAEGPTGFQNLADDTEAAITAALAVAKANPQLTVAIINGTGVGLFAAGTPVSVVPWGTPNPAGTTPAFVTTVGTTVRFTRSGLYFIHVALRAVMDTPSTTAQYFQMAGTGVLAGWSGLSQFGFSAIAEINRFQIQRVPTANVGTSAADGTITANVWAGPTNGAITASVMNILRLAD